jgi:hypothetical protein
LDLIYFDYLCLDTIIINFNPKKLSYEKNYYYIINSFFTISIVFSQSIRTSEIRSTQSKVINNYNRLTTSTYVITHSPNQTIIDNHISVACSTPPITSNNSYLRVFDLVSDFGINADITISSVDFGIQSASAASGGSQSVTINIYTLSGPSDPLLYANLTLIGSQIASVPDQALTLFNVPISAFIPAGSVLVAEVLSADAGNEFWMGCNNIGSTDASYFATTSCNITNPVTVTSINFPDAQSIIIVNAEPAPPVPLSNWALLASTLLIGVFIVVRYRKNITIG